MHYEQLCFSLQRGILVIAAVISFQISAWAQYSGFVKPVDWAPYNGTVGAGQEFSVAYRGNYSDGSEETGSHPGIDIVKDSTGHTLTTNTQVHAIYDGVIIRKPIQAVNLGNGWGNCLVIKHTGIPDIGSIISTYAHLSRFVVNPATGKEWEVGDPVSKGAVLGFVGSTGRTTGLHLHFQIDLDYEDSHYAIHPFWPNRTDGTSDAAEEVDVPDLDGLVSAHTYNPIPFVESRLESAPSPTGIGVNFIATVTAVSDPTGVLGNAIPTGTTATGTFNYELIAPDHNPTDPTDGRYYTSQPLSITFNTPTGPIVVSTDGVTEITVANNSIGWAGGDAFTIYGLGSSTTWQLPFIKFSDIALQVYDLAVASKLLISDQLPTTLNLGGASATGFIRTNYIVSPGQFDNLYSVSFTITQMTFGLTNIPTQPSPPDLITVDGNPSDWAGLSPIVQDAVGDVDISKSLDIKNVSMTNDSVNLYVLVEYESQSAQLNPSQGLDLYLDMESNVGCRSWPFCTEAFISVNLQRTPTVSITDIREGGSGRVIASSILPSYAVSGRFVELGIPLAELRKITPVLSKIGFYLYAGLDDAGVTSSGAASYIIH